MAKIRLDIPAPPSVAGAAPQAVNYPIPNLPKMGGVSVSLPAIPQADFGQGITARYQAPPPIDPGILKPLDIEGKIPQLMQAQMDEGPYLEAGKAAARQGLAVASAGAAIGGALNDLAMLSQGLQQSKDSADISRAHNIWNLGIASYEEAAASVPMSERPALWRESKAQIAAGLRGIGMSASVGDRIGAEWQIAEIKQRTKINHDARQEMIKNDTEAIHDEIKNAMASGDFVQAAGAIGRLGAAGLATPAQVSHLNKQLEEERQAWDIQQLINSNPRAGLQEMQEFNETGKSDIFPNLKNPAIAARAEIAAREAVNRREIDASEAITDGINAGRIKNKQDIELAARGNLTTDRVEAYSRALAANPAYNAESATTMKTAVSAYDPKRDPDMSRYHSLHIRITTELPKDLQKPLLEELGQTIRDSREGKDKTPNQKLMTEVEQRIDRIAKIGGFDPKGYDRERATKDGRYAWEKREVEGEIWTKVETYKESMRQWGRETENFTPKQAEEQLSEIIGSDLKDAAMNATAPPRPGDLSGILPPGAARQQEERATPPDSANLSETLIERAKQLEGWDGFKAKWDSGQWSVGYGSRASGPDEEITQEEADRRLSSELAMHASNVDSAAESAGLTMSESTRNALILFDYNTGAGAYLIESSNGNLAEIKRRLPSWNQREKGSGPDRGLVNRRAAELAMIR